MGFVVVTRAVLLLAALAVLAAYWFAPKLGFGLLVLLVVGSLWF